MFTDMLDSTKRYDVQGDETAFKYVSKHFELLEPIVFDNNGRILKTAGDSIMAVFENPNDGVQSAIIMQRTLFDYNLGKDLDETIEIRIGLHYGEVTEKENDIFGDKANVASRIESLADEYCIFISKELKKIIDPDRFMFIYIGDYDVKGKLEPITVYGILWSKNINWLKNIYQKTKKNLEYKQNKNRIEKERKKGNIGKTGKLKVITSIEIITQPAGAKVWLDNRLFHKRTPFTTDYKVGELNLRIEKQGFKTINDQIDVYEYLPNKIFIQLEDLRGSIQVETDEPGFRITINKTQVQKNKTPYKFKDLLPGKYLISVMNDTQFSYSQEVKLKEKQHLVFKPKVFFFSNIAFISKYKNNILLIKNLNDSSTIFLRQTIKYKTDVIFLKGISQEIRLKPGKYLIESETYPFLKAEIEIDSPNLTIIDFDELIPKVQFKAICGKYESHIQIKYENRIDGEKFVQSGNITRQIFPDKSSIIFQYKSITKKLNYYFTKNSFEFNFEEIIKRTIRKKFFEKVAKILPLILFLFCVIYFGPMFYKKYIFTKIPLIKNKITDLKISFEQKEKTPVISEKIQTGSLQIFCSAENVGITIWGKDLKKNIKPEKTIKIPIGEYKLFIYAKNYKTQTNQIKIKGNEKLIKEYVLEPIFETPPNLVFVRGGTFIMGGSFFGKNAIPHKVKIYDFYIGKFEVTQEEWTQILINNPACFVDSHRPIENISWFEAINYCNRRSELENLSPCYTIKGSKVFCNFRANGYRLPTEAEWEFAARGGTNSKNYIYSGSNCIDEVAWFQDNSSNKTHPVGTKKANELGIFDMSGNVWEWCWDLYGRYPEKMQINPKGSDLGKLRTRRQGSWNRAKIYSRIGFRETSSPNVKRNSIGFRYARTSLGD